MGCAVPEPASSTVCTSHTFSLLVFHSFIRALRACTMSSMMSSCRLWMLPIGSVAGGPVDVWLSRRDPSTLRKEETNEESGATGGWGRAYRPPAGIAATDSRRPRPNTFIGTFEIVTTEWRRPDGCGACDSVARNSASLGDGPEPSPPRSDSRRTWLAVMPSVTCCDGSECLRVSRGSRHGDSRYGFTGESISRLSRGVDLVLDVDALASSPTTVSSTTILQLSLNDGVNDDRRKRLKCSAGARTKLEQK